MSIGFHENKGALMQKENTKQDKEAKHFIQEFIEEDLQGNTNQLITRFPPEPNGHLHIGHAKSITLNFGLSKYYGGKFNLRFDDTNPTKENMEYVDSIISDVSWLLSAFDENRYTKKADWVSSDLSFNDYIKEMYNDNENLFFASNYFNKLYEYAVLLIKKGLAFVCDLNADEMHKYRGTFTEKGKESPYRNRSIEENLKLFNEMKQGNYNDGEKTLRAKIDMQHSNIAMRDPVMYRISHHPHFNTGNAWCIYPMYDYAHPIEDAIEGITHSLCSLEFENNRPLYNWYVNNINFEKKPRQIEFAKLQITNTILGKRHLKKLVDEGYVQGWDDPRLPTLKGLKRRGYTAEIIKNFCNLVGISKADSKVDIAMLEHCAREVLKQTSQSIMAVTNPLKVVITNYPQDKIEYLQIENNSEINLGTRQVPFGREIYIESEDFMENPPKKFFRLAPGTEVRLKGAYFIKCDEVIKDTKGNIVQLNCTYDLQTKSGTGFTGRKVKGTIHWVFAPSAIECKIQLFDYISNEEGTFNENSLQVKVAYIEPYINETCTQHLQFLRHGYFIRDSKLPMHFNCVVNLKSSY